MIKIYDNYKNFIIRIVEVSEKRLLKLYFYRKLYIFEKLKLFPYFLKHSNQFLNFYHITTLYPNAFGLIFHLNNLSFSKKTKKEKNENDFLSDCWQSFLFPFLFFRFFFVSLFGFSLFPVYEGRFMFIYLLSCSSRRNL